MLPLTRPLDPALPRSARTPLLALLALLGACATGPDPAVQGARDVVRDARLVFLEAEDLSVPRAIGRIGEGTELASRLERTLHRLDMRVQEAHRAVEIWSETGNGSTGWRTLSPCVAAALRALGDALEEAGGPVPAGLEEAFRQAASTAGSRCPAEQAP